MKREFALGLALVLGMCVTGSALAGTVIYSNLNPNPTALYDNVVSAIVGSDISGNGATQSLAAPFTPSITATVTELDVALMSISGFNLFGVYLMRDMNGLPGGQLEGWDTNAVPPGTPCCPLLTLTGNGLTTLSAGTQYWVVVFPVVNNTSGGWHHTNIANAANLYTSSDNGLDWHLFSPSAQGAFEVQGSVPEPGSAALVLAGGLLGILFGRRKRPKIC